MSGAAYVEQPPPVWRTLPELLGVLGQMAEWRRQGASDAGLSALIRRTWVAPRQPYYDAVKRQRAAGRSA